MTVADEKDKLAPQLEEAKWRNRQLEKDVQQLQETSAGQEQVLVTCSNQTRFDCIVECWLIRWLLVLLY